MDDRNLPAKPDPYATVQVLTAATATSSRPSILGHLRRVQVDPKTAATEAARYSGLTNLNPAEKGALAAYEAVAAGRVVIDLRETLSAAISDIHREGYATPILAVSRPWSRTTWVRVFPGNGVIDFHERKTMFGRLSGQPLFSITQGRGTRGTSWQDSRATVPTVPPEIRQAHREALQSWRHLLLWEARWQSAKVHSPRPPHDPALLEHLSGDLYLVVAVWDLTPLEAAALTPGLRIPKI